MDNLNQLISKTELNHRKLSNRMGKSANWFNDAYNNNEDIYISSFVRLLSVITQEIDLQEHKLLSLFDAKILEIASLIGMLADEDASYISEFIQAEKIIFMDLLGDWASMASKSKLDDIEKMVMNQVSNLIKIEEDI